ncbi:MULTISPECIES: ribonuclease E inhibitor RraB [Breznakia]|uniref:Regulator of ribonuclease activity B n=1 Tax=Breznakia blatticola TaxID=1754012 RepID=A0A4R8A2V3_9FIRM|nr:MULTISPECIES: ribonuclease E inhibitor RraB [Breznakia]MDH6366157.1 hypothetical protein [Breznakia sp. PH1-1]MDH6403250.1 hypothetical protein [Breznakia sp. PF1-11]MDH6410959.1 hypothetical protein [Breznakia sp. PFB1-11]MDH6413323.1 hypothetical protein [Breznakia sp. PFB1-14]MDH6416088.1 hypothetical protein [Breznakia sp. PFB1-4]
MKKTLGLLAALTAAAAVAVYKLSKDDEKKIKELDDSKEKILRSVEEQGFEPVVTDKEETGFVSNAYPHLTEADLIELTKKNDEMFATIADLQPTDEYPIQHMVQFAKPIDLEEFKNIVISEGYVITGGEKENELLVLHISKMDHDDISAKVFYLANLAKAHDGVYEGWICKK